jgi:hypothetical protein
MEFCQPGTVIQPAGRMTEDRLSESAVFQWRRGRKTEPVRISEQNIANDTKPIRIDAQ